MQPALRVAVAQTAPPPHLDDAFHEVTRRAELAAGQGTSLIVYPELSLIGYDLDRLADSQAWFASDDPRLHRLVGLSSANDIAIVLGVPWRTVDGRRLLASLFVDRDRVTVIGKQHLHGRERDFFEPGDRTDPVHFLGWRLGFAVCFDAAVPAHAQRAADAGADAYIVSAFYSEAEHERMAIHMAARATDHRMYAIVANFASNHQPVSACGGSGVWGPDGQCVIRADGTESTASAEIDRRVLTSWRTHDHPPTI